MKLQEYVKVESRNKVKLSDIIRSAEIPRSTLQDWYNQGKRERIDMLIYGELYVQLKNEFFN